MLPWRKVKEFQQGVRALERTGVRSAAFEAVIAAFEKTKELGKQ